MFWLPVIRHSDSAPSCRDFPNQMAGLSHEHPSSTPPLLPPPPSYVHNAHQYPRHGRRRSSSTSYPPTPPYEHHNRRALVARRMSMSNGDGNASVLGSVGGSQPPEDSKEGLKLVPPKERRFKLSRWVRYISPNVCCLMHCVGHATGVGELQIDMNSNLHIFTEMFRRRRIKCDEGHPCQSCLSASSACTFEEPGKRTHPHKSK